QIDILPELIPRITDAARRRPVHAHTWVGERSGSEPPGTWLVDCGNAVAVAARHVRVADEGRPLPATKESQILIRGAAAEHRIQGRATHELDDRRGCPIAKQPVDQSILNAWTRNAYDRRQDDS